MRSLREAVMGQLFSRHSTVVFRTILALLLAGSAAAIALGLFWVRSDSYWNVGKATAQPIPFRHDLHAGTLGIDCRYCHTAVERSASAGMPSAHTCMTCHSQIWKAATLLEPLRTSVALGQPIVWNSVHRLPDHARFHHGVHTANSIACSTCHGEVETMAQTVKTRTLSMGWCLECHRSHHKLQVEPVGTKTQSHLATAPLLTNCSTCHR